MERGLELERECVARGKKPILELAGNDCVVVWADADLDRAVEALTECFYGSGQICMVPNQVVAHPAIADALCDKLAAAAATDPARLPGGPGVLLSPVLRSERFFAYVRDALGKGAGSCTARGAWRSTARCATPARSSSRPCCGSTGSRAAGTSTRSARRRSSRCCR